MSVSEDRPSRGRGASEAAAGPFLMGQDFQAGGPPAGSNRFDEFLRQTLGAPETNLDAALYGHRTGGGETRTIEPLFPKQ